MSKKYNILINVITGIISQVAILLLGFVIPRIFLTHYGSDVNGFTSTITQIFTYMALLQAGISQSARNVLYKPIKENNQQEISYYISCARNNYRKISYYYMIIVFIFALFLPCLLKTQIDYRTVFLYIIFEGLTSVVSFYYIEVWICLLNVDGKQYVSNLILMISKILTYSIKIILALYNINIAFIQVGYFCVSLIQLCVFYIYMGKYYDWIDYEAAPKNARLPNRNSFIITEVAWTIFSSTDMIVLSIFVSTALSSVYSIYNMVFISLNAVVNAIYTSINYKLGNAYVKDKERYIKLHDNYNSIFLGGMTMLLCTTYILLPSFIDLYTKGVKDINYHRSGLPLLFCLIQFFSWSRSIGGNLIGVAGRIKKAVWISIVEAILNLSLSIILVNFFDIIGVVLATVIALPLKVIYNNYIADIVILKRKPYKTLSIIVVNFLAICFAVFISKLFSFDFIYSYMELFFVGIIVLFFFVVFVSLINSMVNPGILVYLRKCGKDKMYE